MCAVFSLPGRPTSIIASQHPRRLPVTSHRERQPRKKTKPQRERPDGGWTQSGSSEVTWGADTLIWGSVCNSRPHVLMNPSPGARAGGQVCPSEWKQPSWTRHCSRCHGAGTKEKKRTNEKAFPLREVQVLSGPVAQTKEPQKSQEKWWVKWVVPGVWVY